MIWPWKMRIPSFLSFWRRRIPFELTTVVSSTHQNFVNFIWLADRFQSIHTRDRAVAEPRDTPQAGQDADNK